MRTGPAWLACWLAGGIATAAACTSFEDAPDSSSSDGGPAVDGGAPPYCENSIASASADFATSKVVFEFDEQPLPGGTISWSETGGVNGTGALEAKAEGGQTQAQIARDFPIGSAKRARLSFAAKVVGVPSGGRLVYGCTLQLETEPLDGGNTYVEVFFEIKDSVLKLDQDSNAGGSGIDSIPIASASTEWLRFSLEMTDIAERSVHYRAFAGGMDVTPATRTIPLQSAPLRLRVKCGIDDTNVAADVLVDDVSFEMCTP